VAVGGDARSCQELALRLRRTTGARTAMELRVFLVAAQPVRISVIGAQ
jgi:hypothetical protein